MEQATIEKPQNSRCVIDALGNSVQLFLTGGQVHDAKVAIELLSRVKITGSISLRIKLMTSNKSVDILPLEEQCIPFYPRVTLLIHGPVIFASMRNGM